MRFEFRVKGFDATPAMRDHAERRLGFALSRFGHLVEQVRLRVEDVNGPKGGPDKWCRLEVVGSRLGWIVVEETDADFYGGVSRVMDRAGRAVARAIERLRERAPRPPDVSA